MTACSGQVTGRPVSIYDDPNDVAGLRANTGPSGPRPGVSDADRKVTNGDTGEIDKLATNAVADIEDYWRTEYPKFFDPKKRPFKPVAKLISWDATAARDKAVRFCGNSTYKVVNAAFCGLDNTIGWDRGRLLPDMVGQFGKMSVVMVLAHEYGHALQFMGDIAKRSDRTIVKEQQADCFSGVFIRYVAEGRSKHFTINTTDGLNKVLAATVSLRDNTPVEPTGDTTKKRDNEHGSSFDRVSAVQMGFTDGTDACKKINLKEIETRRHGLPAKLKRDDSGKAESGDLPITADGISDMADAMHDVLPLPKQPDYKNDGLDTSCPELREMKEPKNKLVLYCPSSNKISSDVDGMAKRGQPTGDDEGLPSTITGDFTAYIVFISRYIMAVQKNSGKQLTDAKAGLRTACMSGAAAAKLSDGKEHGKGRIQLSAGDLDEAVSGLLTDGLAASNLIGQAVPSGFARVDAFQAGVLRGQQVCEARYN